jgi:hypothetical protein
MRYGSAERLVACLAMSSYAEIVAMLLWGRGLNPADVGGKPFHLGEMIRSWQCSECREWAVAFAAHSLEVTPDLVADNAEAQPVEANRRCAECNGPGDLSAFVKESGDDEAARDPANYTPDNLVKAFLWMDRNKKQRVGEA